MSFESIPQEKTSKEVFVKSGTFIHLREIKDNAGGLTFFQMSSDVAVGNALVLGNGQDVGTIESIERTAGRLRIVTNRAVYELGKSFKGTELESDIGTVTLPKDAKSAKLAAGSARPLESGSQKLIVINRDELKNILLETNGAVIHVFEKRYIVVARVWNAHIPFYRSSSGTGGKRQGEWYPFFGDTGSWIIKGSVSENGDMNYHSTLTQVQNQLNENLILPDTTYLDRKFEIRTRNDELVYAVGNEITFDDIRDSQYWLQDDELKARRDFVARITGYVPEALDGYSPVDKNPKQALLAKKWVADIIASIDI